MGASMKHEYDLIVIGGGSAGLTASRFGASVSAKTLLIEKGKLGGICTWAGCIPGKIMLHQARLAASGVPVTFETVSRELKERRNYIYEQENYPDKLRSMGIDVAEGQASFVDQHTLSIRQENGETRQTTGRYIIIATGSKPYIPSIAGIGRTPYLTNHSLFELPYPPESMIIVGAGPAGTEMAQAFQRLGTDVTLVDMSHHILPCEPAEITSVLQKKLEDEGVSFLLGATPDAVQGDQHQIVMKLRQNGETIQRKAEKLFFATGRRVNLESLKLPNAGIRSNSNGIIVNSACRTNRNNIYAAGDVTGRYQLTHMSGHMAEIAARNALLRMPVTIDARHVPWAIYTSPEIAHVGITRYELEKSGKKFETYRLPYHKIDRAVTDRVQEGWILVYAKKRSGKILGADIVGEQAGELISQFTLAMKNGISLKQMADTIYPYPTIAFGARRTADQWYVKKQNLTLIKWIRRLFRFRGPMPDLSDPDRIV